MQGPQAASPVATRTGTWLAARGIFPAFAPIRVTTSRPFSQP